MNLTFKYIDCLEITLTASPKTLYVSQKHNGSNNYITALIFIKTVFYLLWVSYLLRIGERPETGQNAFYLNILMDPVGK